MILIMTNLARRSDPSTSHQAASDLVASGRHSNQLEQVLEALKESPKPLTSAELAQQMGSDRYLTARRLPDLRKRGLVEQGGSVACTVRGTLAVTWRAL